MNTLLSLFDYSCHWSGEYYDAGWDVYNIELKFKDHPFCFPCADIMDLDSCEQLLELNVFPDGILAAPPCTDFAGSGARWWKEKDSNGATEESLKLIHQTLDLIDFYKPDFWVLENPVGRLTKLVEDYTSMYGRVDIGSPQYFNPCDYAGYLDLSSDDLDYLAEIDKKDGVGVTFADWEHIIKCNAYTKKTGLWGDFTMPEPKPSKPVKAGGPTIGTSAMNRLGGKSDKTKELRSNAPMGFSKAFFEANQGGYNRWCAEDDENYIEGELEHYPVNPKDTRALSIIEQYK